MNYDTPYRIFPLGDTAITIDFGNYINENINQKVMTGFHHLQKDPLPGTIEVVPAYSSLTLYYDISSLRKHVPKEQSVYEWTKQRLEERLARITTLDPASERRVRIPVCYQGEFAPDIEELATTHQISVDEVINIHLSRPYRVYMLGFLPGFAYLGEVDERITMHRKAQPGMVTAGSVGIAGRQTGIYPLTSPGGWQIIGRTPLHLFDSNKKEEPTLLKAGDIVEFYSISTHEFANY
jgi:inhibitor of KinA